MDVVRAEGLNVYDVLRHKSVLFTKTSLAAIEARLGDSPAAKSAEEAEA